MLLFVVSVAVISHLADAPVLVEKAALERREQKLDGGLREVIDDALAGPQGSVAHRLLHIGQTAQQRGHHLADIRLKLLLTVEEEEEEERKKKRREATG